ncbi:type II secretion system GspH family protein, partial [Patescibacteria group bacterium]|nr:type II secretion system GspH family protein [Patescibacteria group bacterium]
MKKNGFSLLELLITMGVMMILISVVLASSTGSRRVARDSQRKVELGQIQSALEVHRSDNGHYPTALSILVPDYTNLDSLSDPSSADYRYGYSRLTTTTYNLCAYLETGGTVIASGCGGTYQCGVSPTTVLC